MTELVVGKYEFYPYPKEFREPSPTLEELVELLREAKAESEKEVTAAGCRSTGGIMTPETSSRSDSRRRPRRKRRG